MKIVRLNESDIVRMVSEALAWTVGDGRQMPNVVSRMISSYCKGRKTYEDAMMSGSQCEKFDEFQREYNGYVNGGSVSPEFMEKLFSTYRNVLDSKNRMTNKNAKRHAWYKDVENNLKSRGIDVDEVYNNYLTNGEQ
jgi:hypothetical protein